MKDPKPTKKELATQTRGLEEQLSRLKNRLNGQVFKKTKHGYRLDQLSEGARQLSGRIGAVEKQLAKISQAQADLAQQWQALDKETDTSQNQTKQKSGGGKKRIKARLAKLKSSVAGLSLMQQQIGKTLEELQRAVGGIGNVRDDLKLETDELRAQVRHLEESSSRLSVGQSSHEARTMELEGLLAELTLAQEKLSSERETQDKKVAQQLEEAISPLREQLQYLAGLSSEDNGRHKQVDRRLHELANRIGDLSGRFGQLQQDTAGQHQKQALDSRLQQLEARISDIGALEDELGASLEKETGALWQKLEKKSNELDTLRERLETSSGSGQSPELSQKLSRVEVEVNRLSQAGDLLQESFRGLGGLELNLTSRLDGLQRQLQEHIGHNRELEQAIQRLSGEFGDIGSQLEQRLEQSDLSHQDRVEALEQRQELLTEPELKWDARQQEVDGQLDRIMEAFTAEQERVSRLEQDFSEARDQSSAQALALDQGKQLQQALESRFNQFSESITGQAAQDDTLTTRVEEQSGQLQALASSLDTLDARVGVQQQRIENSESRGKINQAALFVLLLIGLLGGMALYFSTEGNIAESEQQITRTLISPDPRYVTHDDLAENLSNLESLLAGNSQRINQVSAALPSEGLRERQSELEQQLARFEVKLNLLAASAQESAERAGDSGQPLPTELNLLQLEIERINRALTKLTTEVALRKGEADKAGEMRLGETTDQLSARISQLETGQSPEPVVNRIADIEQTLHQTSDKLGANVEQLHNQQNTIAKIERSLNDTSSVLGERLNDLETESADAREMIRQLQNQMHTLTQARETASQKSVSTAEYPDTAEIWQAAAAARQYTVQLAGSRNKESLIAFASGQALQQDAAYVRTVHEGREWFILLYGRYSSFRDASNALQNLPAALNRYSPWIRTIPGDVDFIVR